MKRGDEMRARSQDVSFWAFKLGFDVVEIDTGERLLDVEVAGLARTGTPDSRATATLPHKPQAGKLKALM